MTSVTFGGGPTLHQRRDFSGLKDGTQVPGYRGYIPQFKYHVGKTYGGATEELAKSYEHRHPIINGLVPQPPPPHLKNELPDSTGDNKYTKNMVPGYTGYIPRMPFKFGDTYKVDCDVCIDQHLTNIDGHRSKLHELRMATRNRGSLKSKAEDPFVKNHLNTYRDTHPNMPILLDSKRGPVEPPIPGYQGYVPRIRTTEAGLGARYHNMTKNGLEMFKSENDFARASLKAPLTGTLNRPKSDMYMSDYARRLYVQDGMIPKYTGYMPQRVFNFGNTYGNTTRSLEVCAHDKSCFGEHMKGKTLRASLC